MNKRQLADIDRAFREISPEGARSLVLAHMTHEGECRVFHAGSDGDTLILAELSAHISKSKMLGQPPAQMPQRLGDQPPGIPDPSPAQSGAV